ncbi:MAG: toll/interleukin-1 receptor domain-containing protein [Henriciella sp.]
MKTADAGLGQVFISYAHEDVVYAKALRDALTDCGYSVWWDEELIANDAFRIKIGETITDASAVVVIWSDASIASHWVREEALSGLLNKKLVATCVPGFSRQKIPYGFREINTEFVDQTDDILKALSRNGAKIQAAGTPVVPEPAAPSRPDIQPPVGASEEPADLARPRAAVSLWAAAIFIATFGVGFVSIIVAGLINVNFVSWTPSQGAEGLAEGVKQVGYMWSLNWSLTATVLMPLAWTFVFLALANVDRIIAEMTRRNMILTADLRPITPTHPHLVRMRHDITKFVVLMAIAVTGLAIVYALVDYYQVIGAIAADPSQQKAMDAIPAESNSFGFDLDHSTVERDWSVATYLSRGDGVSTGENANIMFDLAVYVIYAGFGVGSLFSFMFVIIGIGVAFLPGVAQTYQLCIVPDLNSKDPRGGFEVFQTFTAYALVVIFMVLVFCYLMSTQNIYLRTTDATFFDFLEPDIAALTAGSTSLAERIDALTGFLFAASVPSTAPQNVFIWIIVSFIVIGFLGGYVMFLKQGAINGRTLLQDEIRNIGFARLRRITSLDETQMNERLSQLDVWPLQKLGILRAFAFAMILVLGIIFYKAGLIIILLFVLYGTWNLSRRS